MAFEAEYTSPYSQRLYLSTRPATKVEYAVTDHPIVSVLLATLAVPKRRLPRVSRFALVLNAGKVGKSLTTSYSVRYVWVSFFEIYGGKLFKRG